eukprot:266508_1
MAFNLLAEKHSPVQFLRNPPHPFPAYDFMMLSQNPQYHYIEGHFIYAITNHGIIKYDLDKQTIAEQYNYPHPPTVQDAIGHVKPTVQDAIGHFNPANGIFYILDEYYEWITFDVNKNKWDMSFYEDEDEEAGNVTFKYIPSPINQLHFIQGSTHFVISDDDDDDEEWADELASNPEISASSKLIYDANRKKKRS